MAVLENAARWRPDSGFGRDEDQKIMDVGKPEPSGDRLPSRDGAAPCEVPRKAF